MTQAPKLPILRMDTLQRINNAIKVCNEFLDPFTDAEQFKKRSETEFLQVLKDQYFDLIVWLALRRLDAKEETFQGIEMVVDAIFLQLIRFYCYKELPPSDWSDLKKLGKTYQEIYNRERKFVGKQTDHFRRAMQRQNPKLYEYFTAIWTGSPMESDVLWKKVRNLS